MNKPFIQVWFNHKKFTVRRERYIELLEATVKSALPNDYVMNNITLSKSSESAYISVLSETNDVYFFRISSHNRQKGVGFRNQEFNTNNYVDFKGLRQALQYYFMNKGGAYIHIGPFRYLALDLVVSITTKYREINLHLLPQGGRLRKEIKSLSDTELLTVKNGIVFVSGNVNQLRDNLHERFTYKETRQASELMLNDILYRDITQPRHWAREFKEVVDKKYNVVTATQNKAQYQWYIPKYLRGKIQVGDEIIVMTKYGISQVVVDELSVSDRVDFKPVMQKKYKRGKTI